MRADRGRREGGGERRPDLIGWIDCECSPLGFLGGGGGLALAVVALRRVWSPSSSCPASRCLRPQGATRTQAPPHPYTNLHTKFEVPGVREPAGQTHCAAELQTFVVCPGLFVLKSCCTIDTRDIRGVCPTKKFKHPYYGILSCLLCLSRCPSRMKTLPCPAIFPCWKDRRRRFLTRRRRKKGAEGAGGDAPKAPKAPKAPEALRRRR